MNETEAVLQGAEGLGGLRTPDLQVTSRACEPFSQRCIHLASGHIDIDIDIYRECKASCYEGFANVFHEQNESPRAPEIKNTLASTVVAVIYWRTNKSLIYIGTGFCFKQIILNNRDRLADSHRVKSAKAR